MSAASTKVRELLHTVEVAESGGAMERPDADLLADIDRAVEAAMGQVVEAFVAFSERQLKGGALLNAPRRNHPLARDVARRLAEATGVDQEIRGPGGVERVKAPLSDTDKIVVICGLATMGAKRPLEMIGRLLDVDEDTVAERLRADNYETTKLFSLLVLGAARQLGHAEALRYSPKPEKIATLLLGWDEARARLAVEQAEAMGLIRRPKGVES